MQPKLGPYLKRLSRGSAMTAWLLMSWLAFLICGCRSTLTPLPPKENRSYQSLLEWTHQNGIPGAILFVRTPQTNFVGSIGWANAKRKIPMRPDHAFRIASATKMFLGILAAQLHAEGRLNTDLVITNYLPTSITSRIQNSDRITVRQLVQHTSGICDFGDNYRFLVAYLLHHDNPAGWPAMRQLEYAYGKPGYFPPDQGWAYSNTDFLLLGLIIDQVTGHHHSVEIRKRILDPLGLTNTYYEVYEPPRGERAHGYEKPVCWTVDVTDWAPTTGGHDGMVSTVSDLATFVRAAAGTNSFLNDAARTLLKNRTSRGSSTFATLAQSKIEGTEPWYPVSRYDFGMYPQRWVDNDVPVAKAPLFFGHGGADAGYKCEVFHEPSHDITIVYFGSSTQGRIWNFSRGYELVRQLGEALFELSVEQTCGNPTEHTTTTKQSGPQNAHETSDNPLSPKLPPRTAWPASCSPS